MAKKQGSNTKGPAQTTGGLNWNYSTAKGYKVPTVTPTNPYTQKVTDITAFINAAANQGVPTAGMGTMLGGKGGGGGGGGGGVNPAQVRQAADETFAFNEAPYWQMQAAVDQQRGQANAYNPDFDAMAQQYQQRAGQIDQDRQAAIAQRLAGVGALGSQLAGQQGTAMAGALRDLGAQGAGGVPMDRYVQQANQMGAERAGALTNQGAYMTALNAAGANNQADFLNSSNLITQGGQANLANNRGTLLNQLAQQQAQISLQGAQARQANDQAKREFLLKYGVV